MSMFMKIELQEMAIEVIEDNNESGLLSFQLIITMSALTNIDPDSVLERIKEYARG